MSDAFMTLMRRVGGPKTQDARGGVLPAGPDLAGEAPEVFAAGLPALLRIGAAAL